MTGGNGFNGDGHDLGSQGHTDAPAQGTANQTATGGIPEGTKRKQRSGAENRKRRRMQAQVQSSGGATGAPPAVLMPRVPTEQELASLTGTARESARCYREWRLGRITHGDYLVAVRGLGVHSSILASVEAERTRQETEKLHEQFTRYVDMQAGRLVERMPALDSAVTTDGANPLESSRSIVGGAE